MTTNKRRSKSHVRNSVSTKQAPMRARARLLSLLGEQLIGNDQLAIFELVKNAYDADSSNVEISLGGLDESSPTITVEDDGEGMSLETLVGVWLEPGNDHRQTQRAAGVRTPRFNRLPLGEKGVGRFAVHKLGNKVSLITRQKGKPEHSLSLDWNELIAKKYLTDSKVKISSGPPKYFLGNAHGTVIRISDLKRRDWSRGDIRRLQRLITAINSPFEEQSAFRATLSVPERAEWLAGIPSVSELIDRAPWRFEFSLDEDGFTWSYTFTPPLGVKVSGRSVDSETSPLLLPTKPGKKNRVVADPSMLAGIGPIRGSFVAYDKDPKIRALLPQISLLDDFLENSSGVRVYRDQIRVFNYGEPEDDWLGLDLRRVNRPTERLSRNIVIGAINLTLAESSGLREKTNREGFDENEAYSRFRALVLAVVSKFEVERALDKDRLKNAVEGMRDAIRIPVEKPLADLRNAIVKVGMQDRLMPYVDKVERDYNEVRDLMLRAGMAGLNLAIVFHEAERGVRSLYQAIHQKHDAGNIELQASALMRVFEDIAGLLRQKGSARVVLREVVQTAARLSAKRFERHQIETTYDLGSSDSPISIKGSGELLLGTLTNLIDNAIYWLRVRWPDVDDGAKFTRRLHIAISGVGGGANLIVADNGTGLSDDPETLMRPFFSRRPEGMGLGLYYASMATQLNGGQLLLSNESDFELPQELDGAVITLVFPKERVLK